jgi:hypothetical protein
MWTIRPELLYATPENGFRQTNSLNLSNRAVKNKSLERADTDLREKGCQKGKKATATQKEKQK